MVKIVKVYEFGGPEKLQFEDVELGKPGPKQARVKHAAIGLNMIDTYFRRGQYKADLPFVPGMEGAGTVEEVGSEVTDVRVGDRVCYAGVMGSYVEEKLIDAEKLVKIPDGIEFTVAAALILKGMTTQVLLRKVFKVESGHTIVVHAAAGGVGSLMVQWASSIGATVIACVSNEEKGKQAKADGAQHVIVYSDNNLVERVKEITKGVGVPVVYDSVGKDTFQASLECLAYRGMLVLYGQASGPPEPIPVTAIASKSLFISRPSLMHYTMTRKELEEIAGDLFANVANGVLKVRVHAIYPLSQAAKAHEDLEGRKTTGSTVFVPDSV
jgi:NADPH2:quinone reductase